MFWVKNEKNTPQFNSTNVGVSRGNYMDMLSWCHGTMRWPWVRFRNNQRCIIFKLLINVLQAEDTQAARSSTSCTELVLSKLQL